MTKEPWVGQPIGEVLRLNPAKKADRKAIAKVVQDWLGRGILKRVMRRDGHRDERQYLEVADRKSTTERPDGAAPETSAAGPENAA